MSPTSSADSTAQTVTSTIPTHTVMSPRPSVRDVAAMAGVSVGTVSHVLNHPGRVAASTRERVEQAIEALGFVRSEAARRLREGTSRLVGVVVLDIANPFFTWATRGIEERLRLEGCVPMLSSSDGDAEREKGIMQLLAAQEVRGVIVTPSASTLENIAVLRDRSIPVVLLDHPPIAEDLPTVSGDDVEGGRLAARHLIELGRRRIAFITGPLSVRQAHDRRSGVLEALDEAGLERSQSFVEAEGRAFDADSGAACAKKLLDSSNPPDSFFCANDLLAIGVLREARLRGLLIPQDIAIVGYDDLPLASELITPLTSVHQPLKEMGGAAANLLFVSEGEVRHVTFLPRLAIRESTVGQM